MAETAQDTSIFWVDPERRGVIPLHGFHVSKSLRKRIFSGKYEFSVNTCFEFVLDACANRDKTWINRSIRMQYNALHQMGFAHSVEVWRDEELVGGLYGVCIGGVFFGESMFSRSTDGSKLALVAL
ncbi:MAG: leucyl/phenylalanyl-tRNA--protein transferase, partial [Paracoccaceae bacterium]